MPLRPAPLLRRAAAPWRGFVRGSLTTAVGLAARAAGAVVVGKLVATYAPVGGLTAFSQVQSIMALLTTLAVDGTHVGLVKYLAPLRPGSPRYRAWLGAAAALNAGALLLGAAGLALWPGLAAGQGQRAVLVGGVALGTAQALLGTALLAAGELRAFVALAVAVAALGTGAVAAGLGPGRSWPLPTVLLAYVVGQGLAVVPALALAARAGVLRGLGRRWVARPSRAALRGLARFGLMAVGNIFFGRAVDMAVRALLLARFGPARADVWQAAAKLSDNYSMVVAAVLSSVFYPRLAALAGQPAAARRYLRGVLALLAPGLALGLGALFVARDQLLPLLFAPRLLAARALLAPQMLGDWAKFLSWVFIFQLTARARAGRYVAVQAVSAGLYAALLAGLLPALGLAGAVWAHALRYGLLLLGCVFFQLRAGRAREAQGVGNDGQIA
ncbi:hypothetical protein ACFQ48_03115 [Hymenobacter caeli]|uniref:PST family polysaccharide transporter n=1 Tax=Hymenobacter caeli TaxID=2735894 RepID=A0ABX2FLF6_9BACT|nr:hypothetical protein [Hymenobacter caeli]NRT17816.1 PST family polysaccharide transporter [Hymenobacter caeli]